MQLWQKIRKLVEELTATAEEMNNVSENQKIEINAIHENIGVINNQMSGLQNQFVRSIRRVKLKIDPYLLE